MVQVGLLEALLGGDAAEVLRRDPPDVVLRLGIAVVEDAEDAGEVAGHLLDGDVAVSVDIKPRERGRHFVLPVALA